MTSVFISGSRQFIHLDFVVKERVDKIIANGFAVLIGDADGADRLVQEYLSEKNYANVIVFCTGSDCRNNVGHWTTQSIDPGAGARKGFRFYALKDRKMSEDATYGFALWDGKSKGTLNNILNLLEQQKKVLLYFSPSSQFRSLRTHQQFAAFVTSKGIHLEEMEKHLRIRTRRKHPQQEELSYTTEQEHAPIIGEKT